MRARTYKYRAFASHSTFVTQPSPVPALSFYNWNAKEKCITICTNIPSVSFITTINNLL